MATIRREWMRKTKEKEYKKGKERMKGRSK